jgi:hypothetical protein
MDRHLVRFWALINLFQFGACPNRTVSCAMQIVFRALFRLPEMTWPSRSYWEVQ